MTLTRTEGVWCQAVGNLGSHTGVVLKGQTDVASSADIGVVDEGQTTSHIDRQTRKTTQVKFGLAKVANVLI